MVLSRVKDNRKPSLAQLKGGHSHVIEVAAEFKGFLWYLTDNNFGTLITGCCLGVSGRLKDTVH